MIWLKSLKWRLVLYSFLLVILALVAAGIVTAHNETVTTLSQTRRNQETQFAQILPEYKMLAQKIKQAQSQNIDLSNLLATRTSIHVAILRGDISQAQKQIAQFSLELDALLAKKKTEDEAAAAALAAAIPTPAPSPSAAPKQAATPRPSATPAPSTNVSNTAHSHYEQKSLTTSRGTFTINLLTVDVGPGKARMITDTAADSDCSDNCPTLSLQNYVSRNGGFAGINGTYFCPADYSDCAGKTGSFYWKIFTTRLNKIINQNNGQGEGDPALIFTSDGTPKYFAHWRDVMSSGLSLQAAINSRPSLVEGGNNILDSNTLDDKQRTVKSNRGALGLKGSTIYAVVAKSATVIDLADIMRSLGVDSAMNIDGGGSSALYYNGSYKVGPGRSLPNAVIFAE